MSAPHGARSGRLHVVVSTDTDLLALRTAVEALPAGFPAVTAATTWAPDPIGDLRGASCVLVRLLGGRRAWPDGFDRLRAECVERDVALLAFAGEAVPDAELTAASTVPSATVTAAFAYLVHGGPANLENLLRFVADTVCFDGWGFEPPSPVAEHGVWRQPDPAGTGPVVGIVFYRAHLVAGNTQFVDDLCAAVSAAGGRPLALWCYTLRDQSARPVVELLSRHGARALVTTVLAAGGAASAAGTPGARGGLDGEGWDVSELAELDIPVVQAPSAGRSSEDWAASDAGLGPYDVTSGVAIPELDGRIIAPAFAFSEVVDDG
ncbi:MAG: cobaltochelatase subunit CobN, partial [Actinomycetota bacterium]|nr:cobaltochelatase subunit CobN [Actinomycetota bacterium]